MFKDKINLVTPFRKNILYDAEAVVPLSKKATQGKNMVESPKHYIGVLGMEIEEVLRNFLPTYEDSYVSHRIGSAIEYLARSPRKNGLEDLRKAEYNIRQAIEYIEKKDDLIE